jgi:L-fucose isomerase-like protein
MERVRIGFVPASRTIFDAKLAVKVKGAALEAMKEAGLEPVSPGDDLTQNGLVQTPEEARKAALLFEDSDVAGVVIGALNFGNEVPAAMAATVPGRQLPVMLFGVGEEGRLAREKSRRDAFCGLISIATALRHREVRFAFPRVSAVGYPEDASLKKAFSEFGRACRAVKGVRGAVYAQVGPRPADFETCAYDELSLLRKLGTRIVPVPLSTLFSLTAFAKESRVREVFEDMAASADRSRVSDMDLSKMARLEVVLEDLVEEHGLDGMAIQCWTSFQDDYGISPCFAMARLTDCGVPCACEADVHGTVSMHMLSLVAERPAGLADWNNRHYMQPDVFSAWHCGVFPPSMTRGTKAIGMHDILAASTGTDEGKYGTVELSIDEGSVTMCRVTEHPMEEWPVLVAEGRSVVAEGDPPGSNAWVRVADLDALYSEILRGFPHHTAIARGSCGSAAAVAAYFLGMDPVLPLGLDKTALEAGPEFP